jgi:hypothetical protein
MDRRRVNSTSRGAGHAGQADHPTGWAWPELQHRRGNRVRPVSRTHDGRPLRSRTDRRDPQGPNERRKMAQVAAMEVDATVDPGTRPCGHGPAARPPSAQRHTSEHSDSWRSVTGGLKQTITFSGDRRAGPMPGVRTATRSSTLRVATNGCRRTSARRPGSGTGRRAWRHNSGSGRRRLPHGSPPAARRMSRRRHPRSERLRARFGGM